MVGVPDSIIAVELIGPGYTGKETDNKLDGDFAAGTESVWYVHPERKEIDVYTGRQKNRTRTIADTLDDGNVLPEFRVAVRDVFAVTTVQNRSETS